MKKGNLPYTSLFFANALIYGLTALFGSFMPLYIEKCFPGDDTTLGYLMSIGPLVSIFAPIVWGMLADKAKSKNSVLIAATFGAAVFYFVIQYNNSPIYLAVMMALCMFFASSFGSLVDVITLEYATDTGKSYGLPRALGSIGYGLIAYVLSIFTENDINIIFYAYAIIALFSIISVFTSPRVAGHSAGRQKLNLAPIFKDKKLLMLIFFAIIGQFTWTYYSNSFPIYLTAEDGLNQSDAIWGINVFITLIGEIPFFFVFKKLFEKFSIKTLLFVSLIFTVIRYACLGFISNVVVLLIVGGITGLSVTVFTYVATYYIGRYVAPEIKASANSFLYCASYGVGRVLASVLSGYMTKFLGYSYSMLACSLLGVVGVVVFFFTFARYKLPGVNVQ